jgi:hypothetical protein
MMTNTKEESLTDFIRYLDHLLGIPRIEIKETLRAIKARLEFNGYITEKDFNTLWKFLKRDTNKTKNKILKEYQSIIYTDTQYEVSLEAFWGE